MSASVRILLVEPERAACDELSQGARADAVRFAFARTIAEAEKMRASEVIDLVACAFPIPGGEAFIRGLRGERFPVVVMTDQVQRSIDAFGLRVPVLRKPIALDQLLEQAVELVLGDDRRTVPAPPMPDPTDAGPAGRAIIEIPPAPNPRDPRRE